MQQWLMCSIRPAKNADAKPIASVYVETWRSAYAGALPDKVLVDLSPKLLAASWAHTINSRAQIILVAEAPQAGVVAFTSAGPNRDRASKYRGEVFTLYVLPDFQNRGVGERLLAHVFEALVKAGLNSAVIWALNPTPSRFFYQAMGGRLAGNRHEKLWGTKVEELAYGWDNLKGVLARGRPKLN
jgi:ribosomal protein S18 acetylase RimI-like enzyme